MTIPTLRAFIFALMVAMSGAVLVIGTATVVPPQVAVAGEDDEDDEDGEDGEDGEDDEDDEDDKESKREARKEREQLRLERLLAAGMTPLTIEGCVVELRRSSALVLASYGSLVEVRIRRILDDGFPLNPGECWEFEGGDMTTLPDTRKTFPQAGVVMMAQDVGDPPSHVNSERKPNQGRRK